KHVFIEKGLQHWAAKNGSKTCRVLEIGFGTGLNALVTLLEAEKADLNIYYTGVEAFPVPPEEVENLNYPTFFTEKKALQYFRMLHEAPWDQKVNITHSFQLQKKKQFFNEIAETDNFDLIYFDAFGPEVQPELWTAEIFATMYRALRNSGVLVTYSAKGSVRRTMQEIGFAVERLPGPPGKREMLRGTKEAHP
ncbi:MAG TPA: tRNA (5-methylaminomethyl-2-thiouridine)(34)-methyltransferase MnmD, partial [Salinimicrobium sp.]|nr:tRNA (5-methylaminomethyl-2-thiouridine)(34)-methyltransferase MnmD [Salinimicrobium sp.]